MPVDTPWTLADYALFPSGTSWSSGDLGDTQPVIGNGQLHLRYRRLTGAFQFNLALTIGSTTTLGTNAGGFGWIFLIPGPVPGPGFTGEQAATAWAVAVAVTRGAIGGSSATYPTVPCFGIIRASQSSSPGVRLTLFLSANGVPMDATHPWAWTAGDILTVTGTTEGFDN